MWIVTVMEPYYPSIFEFDDYWLALAKYKELEKKAKEEHNAEHEQFKVHLSVVIKTEGLYMDDKQDWT